MTQLCPLCKRNVEATFTPEHMPVMSTQFGYQRDPGDPVLAFHDAEPFQECKGSGITVKEARATRILLVRWTYPRPR